MSQSRGNYIGLAEPPEEQFGKIMSLPDELMPQYFSLLTDIPWEEVKGLHPKEAKKRLAWEIVRQFHGEEGAARGKAHFERVFEERELPEEVPEVQVPLGLLSPEGTVGIVDLVFATGLVSSRSEARRLVAQGGVQVNGRRVTDVKARIPFEPPLVVKLGKRRFARFVG